MLISYRWLQRHVDLDGIPPERLAQDLTLSTAEVEGLAPFAPHLARIQVGCVQACAPHPDADKLSVCAVDVGGREALQIVCGAPNVDAGQKVAVAQVGTVLPGGFKLKKARIRGVESRGMICSVRELELGDDHTGIWVLPADAAVGEPVSAALGIEDTLLEFDNKSLTHRPDLWGHRGIAAEIAAIYGRELKPLDLSLPPTGAGPTWPVRIESPACARYVALPIDGLRQGPSPDWLRFLLLAVGQRPLDLLVDVSNFVMLDLGQPNHLFDRARLAEGIVVRMARAGELLTTLDGEERRLSAQDLLICAGDEPVALAGVMGGAGSKVAPGTSELLLEVASFDAVTIRRSAARLGLRTDASARFEKTLDPTLPMKAAAHLVRTLQAIQPEVCLPSPPTDAGEWSDPTHTQRLRGARVRRLLGVDVSDGEIAALLRRLHFPVEEPAAGAGDGGAALMVTVPSLRASKDVTIEEDLIEEVGRLYRWDRIAERRLTAELEPPPHDARRELVRRAQDSLAGGARFHEVLTYSFVPDDLLAKVGLLDEPYVEVVNPVAEGERRVRRSVVPSLLGLLERNLRQRADVRLFELAKGYLPEAADERGLPREVHELGLVWARPAPPAPARFDAGCASGLRAVVEELLAEVGRERPAWRAPQGAVPPWLHPGRALEATLCDERGDELPLGLVGELEPGLMKPLGLTAELAGDVAVARLSLDALLCARPRAPGHLPIPRFPGTKLDVALALPDELAAGDAAAAIERCGKGLVASCELFDLYRGASVGAGKKSLAFHLLLQSAERTLTEKDEQRFLERLERAAADLGGELRRE